MELKVCKEHRHPCYLKTGTKDGPNKGKSYYICGRGAGNQCSYVEPVNIPPSYCLVHPGVLVELQAMSTKISPSGETRQYYRCQKTRTEGSSGWCGYTIGKVRKDSTGRNPLSSLNGNQAHSFQSKDKPNPFVSANKPPPENFLGSKERKDVLPNDEKGLKGEEGSKVKEIDPVTLSTHTAPMTLEAARHKASESTAGGVKDEDSVAEEDKLDDEIEMLQTKLKQQQLTDDKQMMSQKGGSPPSVSSAEGKGDVKGGTGEIEETSSSQQVQQNHPADRQNQPSNVVKQDGDTGAVMSTHYVNEGSLKSLDLKGSNGVHQSVPQSQHQQAMDNQRDPQERVGMARSQMGVTDITQQAQPLSAVTVQLQQQRHQQQQPNNNQRDPQERVGMARSQMGVTDITQQPQRLSAVTVQLHQQRPQQQQHSLIPGQRDTAGIVHHADPTYLANLKMDLTRQLALHQQTLRNVPLSLLPDKGQRLQRKVKEVEADLISVNRQLSELNASSNHVTSAKPILSLREQMMQAMQSSTHPDLMAYQYAANPQMQTLYGGRMTTARLREVGSVTNDAIKKLHDSLQNCPSPDEASPDPKGLKVSLMQHQKQALTWLLWRESQHPCGGILADDMGLGKTLTMISLVMKQKELSVKEEKTDNQDTTDAPTDFIKSKTTLIVCPASLMDHWEKEVERRCHRGTLKVYKYHGPNRTKRAKDLIRYDIVVTTYQIISRELEETIREGESEEAVTDKKDVKLADQPVPLQIGWERVILDEAHNIKNPKSKSAVAICKLRARARWAITGTPIQNNLLDMYALLRFLRFSPFDEYKVWKTQVDNNKRSGNKWLATLMKALLLRRTKDQMNSEGKPLVSLPDKCLTTHEIQLSEQEKKVYDQLFKISRGKVQEYINYQEDKKEGYILGSHHAASSNSFANHGASSSTAGGNSALSGRSENEQGAPSGRMNASQILVMLLRLRQCCTHLSLLKEIPEEDVLQEDGIELSLVGKMKDLGLSDGSLTEDASGEKNQDIGSPHNSSSKVRVVLDAIREIKAAATSASDRCKCVVVSQWTQMLEVVDLHLQRANIRTLTISGTVSQKKRSEAVEDFNNNPYGAQVLLLSLKAGGVGLNLIGGNHLFMMDMHWNPALEEQACDRVYRVGQRKDVKIHKFVCKDTIEERILMLQKKKMQLAKDVLSGSKERRGKLTLDDLKLLFQIR